MFKKILTIILVAACANLVSCSKGKQTKNKFVKVDAIVDGLSKGNFPDKDDTKNWTTHEWLHFIRHIPVEINSAKLQILDNTFGFTNSGNSEIQAAWYELSIKNGYFKNNLPQIEKFLISVGRRKFLTPLYRAFKENGHLEIAQEIYKKAKPNYHSVSTATMDELLK